MVFWWFIVWFIAGTPPLHQWNAWLVSLIVCILCAGFGAASRAS